MIFVKFSEIEGGKTIQNLGDCCRFYCITGFQGARFEVGASVFYRQARQSTTIRISYAS